MGAIVGTQTEQLAAHEAALLAQVAAGDRGGPLIELYDRYSARVYGLGLRLLGDRGMAEELVQDTFVRLWRSADRFDAGRGSVRTFLFAIARRAAVDLLRRPTSRPLQTTEFPDELTSDPAYEQLLLGLDVRDALNSLSPKHRSRSGGSVPQSGDRNHPCSRPRSRRSQKLDRASILAIYLL